MYQDLSYMKIPLPEDVLKLKNYGDFAGAQKMIDHFMTKDIPNALRKRLEIEKDVLKVIKTVKGNHSRNHFSQRQIDIIKNEIIPNDITNKKETGIICTI